MDSLQIDPLRQNGATTTHMVFDFSADNNFIYALGGEDENRNRLDSVERYDPRYNRWTHITNMPSGAKVSPKAQFTWSEGACVSPVDLLSSALH